jgi:hypothetical protein
MMQGLKHHYGSTHAAPETSLPTLQRLLRHGLTNMIMRYITIQNFEKRKAAEQIEKVFDQQRRNKG